MGFEIHTGLRIRESSETLDIQHSAQNNFPGVASDIPPIVSSPLAPSLLVYASRYRDSRTAKRSVGSRYPLPSMALHRVGSIDGMERDGRDSGSNKSSHRRMSFSPLSDWAPQPDRKASAASLPVFDELPKGKRLCQCHLARIWIYQS